MENKAKKMISSAEKLKGGEKLKENYALLKALSESKEVKDLVSKMSDKELSQLSGADKANAAEQLKKLLSSPIPALYPEIEIFALVLRMECN